MAATDEQILQMAAEIDTVSMLGKMFGIECEFMQGMKAGLICAFYGNYPPEIKNYITDCLNSIGGVKENRYRHLIDERYDTLKESFTECRLRDTGH